ncbi:Alcohol dehydrogenase, class IV [Paenibacillus sp. 1_12]|uniref:iron-containing alcohol dehydrogenase n=1 Tax=Paenibacillus sp. 1_12 TaxID=1566278 RepID=UPI0008EF3EF8|nr:iron-containing alcohol dehydrogenase [Paenibacillus sp. 1_12]SFM28651.1 Alcohol dehydrogenase, class IV [Paenibacillus sp. 1_12]
MTSFQFKTAEHIIMGRYEAENTTEHLRSVLGPVRFALIVSQPSIQRSGFLDRLSGELQRVGIRCRVITEIQPEPTESQLTELHKLIAGDTFDVMIGIGGGSVLDAVKLLAVMATNKASIRDMLGTGLVAKPGIPTLLIPTTSGTGSEVTPNAIVTLPDEELKLAVVSPYLVPQLVILDPILTLSLPPAITAATGMDAYTHALESYISNKANPISDMFALEAIRLISGSLEEVYHNGGVIEARERMLLGSMYGGMALSSSGTAAVHALAYPLGGKYHISHGVANSMLLAHVMEYNFDAISDRLSNVAVAMQLPEAGTARAGEAVINRITTWTRNLQIPQNLGTYGVEEKDIESLAVAASKVTRLLNNNPKPLGLEDIQHIYRKLLV